MLNNGVFAGDPDADPETRSQLILNWIHVAGRVLLGRGVGVVIGILPGMMFSGVLLVVVLLGTIPVSDLDLLEAYLISFTLRCSRLCNSPAASVLYLVGTGILLTSGSAGVALWRMRGRLGGRMTGWPRSRRPVPDRKELA